MHSYKNVCSYKLNAHRFALVVHVLVQCNEALTVDQLVVYWASKLESVSPIDNLETQLFICFLDWAQMTFSVGLAQIVCRRSGKLNVRLDGIFLERNTRPHLPIKQVSGNFRARLFDRRIETWEVTVFISTL